MTWASGPAQPGGFADSPRHPLLMFVPIMLMNIFRSIVYLTADIRAIINRRDINFHFAI